VLADDQSVMVEVPPAPVTVVNGLGAGDAFRRGAVPRAAGRVGLERVMRFANAAGAIVAGTYRLLGRDADGGGSRSAPWRGVW